MNWVQAQIFQFNFKKYIFIKLVIEQDWCPCVSVCLNVSVSLYIDNKVDYRKHKVWYFYKLYRSNKTVHKVHLIDFLPPAFIIQSLCQPSPFSSAILFSFIKSLESVLRKRWWSLEACAGFLIRARLNLWRERY